MSQQYFIVGENWCDEKFSHNFSKMKILSTVGKGFSSLSQSVPKLGLFLKGRIYSLGGKPFPLENQPCIMW